MSDMQDLLVEAVIEIPQGGQNKYEIDKQSGALRLDRVLHSPMHYPAEYGFVPDTLAEDGDPIDILVLISHPTVPGCRVPARLIGALLMEDDRGRDTKLIAVATGDPRFAEVQSLEQLSAHLRKEIEYFFRTYKDLEGKTSSIQGWSDAIAALRELAAARARHRGGGGLTR